MPPNGRCLQSFSHAGSPGVIGSKHAATESATESTCKQPHIASLTRTRDLWTLPFLWPSVFCWKS
eukprot:1012159-Pelagomonas_calceolata.AAC.3